MTPAKALAPARLNWFESLPWASLGDLAVPLAVLAIVIALVTPLPIPARSVDRHRHFDVGDRHDGLAVYRPAD
jgi:hypothetical protein